MSHTFRVYHGISSGKKTGGSLYVTAYVGGEHGSCVQLTMDNDYICLAENQVKDLIEVLTKRLLGVKGYSATDSGTAEVVHPEPYDFL